MTELADDPRGAFATLIAHLLDTLDALEFVGRHLHPPRFGETLAALGDCDVTLHEARERLAAVAWPDTIVAFRDQADSAADYTLRACSGLREATDLRQGYRAMRQVSRALEALYPLAPALPEVSRFFLEPMRREDSTLLAVLAAGGERTGVMHAHNETNERGGFSLYVPETYDPARAHPLVMALHGGSAHGRLFLWSWVREARSRGVILVAPTAQGDTWSLMDPAADSANLARILDQVAQGWNVDAARLLMTGMSDGGTFTLLSGIDDASPFTHLGPVAASFHPLLLTMADPQRMQGLPVYLVHGALDWMFPVDVARNAQRALTAAGAKVVYREVADLSHTYPRDENAAMLDWFLAADGTAV